MVFFIFIMLLMVSLSGVLYLMVRALPRVAEESAGVDGDGHEYRSLLDRWAHSEIPEKIDGWFNEFLLKFLRKFKVLAMKLDNAISSHLKKIHRENEANDKKIDFKDITDGKDDESEDLE